jgi:peptidyl-prolyl cis-trans isomerase A (cyclophilin A)
MKRWTTGALLLGFVAAGACGGDAGSSGEEDAPPADVSGELASSATAAERDSPPPPPAAPAEETTTTGGDVNPLMNPAAPEMNEQAPASFRVRMETSKGEVVLEINRSWSPTGVDRFYNLVQAGFYDGVRFFRVLDGFMAQFGINGDPAIQARWRNANIADDPVVEGNTRGRISFAKSNLPNSRSTQLFINTVDNTPLDEMGFSAIGEVVSGMDVVDALYSGYGEGAPRGGGPEQGQLQRRGNEYLEADFPELDYIITAEIVNDN